MTLLFIRHGETALNASRTIQPADTPLSPRGLAQAAALAQHWAGAAAPQRLAGIVSSDLPRALQTAQALAAVTGLAVMTSPLLQERNFGDWRGQPHASFGFDPLVHDGAPPAGESQAVFAQRVALAFDFVARLRGTLDGPLAVVTHGLVLRQWLAAHTALAEGMAVPDHMGNTGVTIVEAQPPHAVLLLGCTRHLDALAADDAQALSGG